MLKMYRDFAYLDFDVKLFTKAMRIFNQSVDEDNMYRNKIEELRKEKRKAKGDPLKLANLKGQINFLKVSQRKTKKYIDSQVHSYVESYSVTIDYAENMIKNARLMQIAILTDEKKNLNRLVLEFTNGVEFFGKGYILKDNKNEKLNLVFFNDILVAKFIEKPAEEV